MADWRDSLGEWGTAWAAVRDREATADAGLVTVAGDPAEVLLAWPDAAAARHATPAVPGTLLRLVTDDAEGAAAFAVSQGWAPAGALALLTARTEDLDLVPSLPAEANIAEAPMENYDAVEVAVFDRPAAAGRIRLGDGLAVLAGLRVEDGHDEFVDRFEQAMVASLGEEAFLHGADVLYLVAEPAQAARFAAVDGWVRVAEILSFTR